MMGDAVRGHISYLAAPLPPPSCGMLCPFISMGQGWLCVLAEGWGSNVGALLHPSPTECRALLMLQGKSLCIKALGMALN